MLRNIENDKSSGGCTEAGEVSRETARAARFTSTRTRLRVYRARAGGGISEAGK